MVSKKFSAVEECIGIVLLMFIKLGIQKHCRHANKAVHRCPNFMAHVGQEFAFILISGLYFDHQLFTLLLYFFCIPLFHH